MGPDRIYGKLRRKYDLPIPGFSAVTGKDEKSTIYFIFTIMSHFLNNILFVQHFTAFKDMEELVFYLLTCFPVHDKTGVVLKDVVLVSLIVYCHQVDQFAIFTPLPRIECTDSSLNMLKKPNCNKIFQTSEEIYLFIYLFIKATIFTTNSIWKSLFEIWEMWSLIGSGRISNSSKLLCMS